MRTTVFKKAWYLVHTYAMSMSDALKTAWAWYKLRSKMTTEVVRFYFKKTDGTIREAFGTLRSDLIGEVKGTGHKPYNHLQTYWDTEKQGYRSFKIVNLQF